MRPQALLLIVLGLQALQPATTQAEARWVVLPVWTTATPPAWIPDATQALTDALEERAARPLGLSAAVARFQERESTEPATLSQSEIDTLPERSRAAVRNMALGRYKAAREELAATLQLADRGVEELSRETRRARQVLDACLFMVRAQLESGDIDRARSQSLHCRRLVPELEPSRHIHTPEVRELLAEAEDHLRDGPRGTLRVLSQPSGCAVRLNGIRMGTTPFVFADLASHRYRVQVECHEDTGQRGRVHRVFVREGLVTLKVDVAFDKAVHTEPVLSLSYPNPSAADLKLRPHARKLAGTLEADHVLVLVVEPNTPDVARLHRYDAATDTFTTTVRAPVVLGGDGVTDRKRRRSAGPALAKEALGQAADALLAGLSVDLTASEPVRIAAWKPPKPAPVVAPSEPRPREAVDRGSGLSARTLAGLGSAAVGFAGIVGSYVLHFRRLHEADRLRRADLTDADYLLRQQAWLDARTPQFVLGGLGALGGTTASALLVPNDPGMPTWAYVAGAAGAGLAVAGLVETFRGADCNPERLVDDACLEAEHTQDRGLLLLLSAAPLLSVPITAWLRSPTETEPPSSRATRPTNLDLSLNAGHGAASLWLRGDL